jgi:hypothetical protein
MRARGLKQAISYRGRIWLGERPAGLAALRLSPRLRPHVVESRTDVCIEGFPRSGNSLAVHAFLVSNPGANIAHHVHVPMQVLRAVDLGVPCAVLIRDPVDAIASLLIMSENALPRRLAINSYASFYAPLTAVAERVAVVPFEELTSDPFVVAKKLDRELGASFEIPDDEEDGRRRALDSLRRANLGDSRRTSAFTMPAPEKEALKPRVVEELREDARLAELRDIHHALTG